MPGVTHHSTTATLLAKCEERTTLSKQQHRAVAALEWIATASAVALLRRLADGAPAARVTLEARAALGRLEAGVGKE